MEYETKLVKIFKPMLWVLLWPFAFVYALITDIRNFCYDKGIFKSHELPVFSIGVGNLAVGGTGKTPFVSYLLDTFAGKNIAVLSRGYGRNTKGFREVSPTESPKTVGDEIFMLHLKHEKVARFFVCENRWQGVRQLLSLYPKTDMLIFDDVFQHRSVKPAVQIMLSTFHSPFFKDWLMPLGRLRETRRGAKRADVLVFTKCPTHSDTSEFLKFTPSKCVYFTQQIAGVPENIFGEKPEKQLNVNVVSALANNEQFIAQVAERYEINDIFGFSDHHRYTHAELSKLNLDMPIITTEKDFVKLRPLLSESELRNIYVQKVELAFLENEKQFLSILQNAYSDWGATLNN